MTRKIRLPITYRYYPFYLFFFRRRRRRRRRRRDREKREREEKKKKKVIESRRNDLTPVLSLDHTPWSTVATTDNMPTERSTRSRLIFRRWHVGHNACRFPGSSGPSFHTGITWSMTYSWSSLTSRHPPSGFAQMLMRHLSHVNKYINSYEYELL